MQIIWSNKALTELQKILRYGEKEFGQSATEHFYRQIKENELRLSSFPEMGKREQALDTASRQYRSLLLHKNYKLIYYIIDDTIRISGFWSTHRNPDDIFNSIE